MARQVLTIIDQMIAHQYEERQRVGSWADDKVFIVNPATLLYIRRTKLPYDLAYRPPSAAEDVDRVAGHKVIADAACPIGEVWWDFEPFTGPP